MELNYRYVKSPYMRDEHVRVPDYNSTQENFDELEKGIGKLNRQVLACIRDIEDAFEHITALEADSESLQIQLDNLHHNIQDVEAKADAPGYKEGDLIREPHRVDPTIAPDTCGNCGLAWRRDNDKGLVLCDEESTFPRYKANGVPGCPHYDKRTTKGKR